VTIEENKEKSLKWIIICLSGALIGWNEGGDLLVLSSTGAGWIALA
jgi:hypothetical protein